VANFAVRTVAPVAQPLFLEQAKEYAKIEIPHENATLADILTTATERCEDLLGQSLITQTWALTLDSFFQEPFYDAVEGVLKLPRPPLQSVTSITYFDTAGVSQTWSSASYQVDAKSRPGRIALVEGQDWPDTNEQLGAVVITYVAGYGAAEAVPAQVKQAIRLLFNHWEKERGAYITSGAVPQEIPHGIHDLLALVWHGDY
jgi:uncharacterized phiE125 gp8 family phage protein